MSEVKTKIEYVIQGSNVNSWYDIETVEFKNIENSLIRYKKACQHQGFRAIKRTTTDEVIE